MKTYPTAREAIIHSQRHGEMARCENTHENRKLLDIEADCSNCDEYWAIGSTDVNDLAWRVTI
jgi:hypothetical protein